MNPFHPVDERLIHRGHIIDLVEVTIADDTGEEHRRDVIRHPGAVSIVAVEGDHVWMVEQYRAPVDRVLLEIPAGLLDVKDEDPVTAAARELAEEVGFAAATWVALGSVFLTPGCSDEVNHLFLATELTAIEGGPSYQGAEERHMRPVRVPLRDIAPLVASGRLRDAKSALACSLATQYLAGGTGGTDGLSPTP